MKKTLILVLIILISLILSADIKSSLIQKMRDKNVPEEIIIISISMLPIFELRLGLPIAVQVFGMPLYKAFALSFIGNMIPVIPILLLLKWIYALFSKWAPTKKAFDRFFEKMRHQSKKIGKYEFIGLLAFVGVPLPGTGAWTGTAVAVVLNMPFFRALLSITLGVLTAGVIVSILTIMGVWGAVIAGTVLIGATVASLMKVNI